MHLFDDKVKCKCNGRKLVFTDSISKINIFAGGINTGVYVNSNELAISLMGESWNVIQTEGFTPKFIKKTPGIIINWADFSTPYMDKDDWINIINEIRDLKKDVVIFCIGGHGRTGTALTILSYLMNRIKNPLKFVRDTYCKNAVESEEQIDYINEITGLKIKDSASKILRGFRPLTDWSNI